MLLNTQHAWLNTDEGPIWFSNVHPALTKKDGVTQAWKNLSSTATFSHFSRAGYVETGRRHFKMCVHAMVGLNWTILRWEQQSTNRTSGRLLTPRGLSTGLTNQLIIMYSMIYMEWWYLGVRHSIRGKRASAVGLRNAFHIQRFANILCRSVSELAQIFVEKYAFERSLIPGWWTQSYFALRKLFNASLFAQLSVYLVCK